MKKQLADVTLYELARECVHNDDCHKCPFGETKLNCWHAWKMLDDDMEMLDVEVEL